MLGRKATKLLGLAVVCGGVWEDVGAQGRGDPDIRAIQAAVIDLYAGNPQDSMLITNLGAPLERSDDLRVLVFHAFPGIDAPTLESFEDMVRVGEMGAPLVPPNLPTARGYRVGAGPAGSPGCARRTLTIGPVGFSPAGTTAAVFSDHWGGVDIGAGVTYITFLRLVDGRWEKQAGVEAYLYSAAC